MGARNDAAGQHSSLASAPHSLRTAPSSQVHNQRNECEPVVQLVRFSCRQAEATSGLSLDNIVVADEIFRSSEPVSRAHARGAVHSIHTTIMMAAGRNRRSRTPLGWPQLVTVNRSIDWPGLCQVCVRQARRIREQLKQTRTAASYQCFEIARVKRGSLL
jgi:hypothetical protein